jgi:hypothetical protein
MVHTLLEQNIRWFDYLCLGLLIVVSITLIYAVIYIHDIPYEIAKKRNHPHQDAIHTAGWVSLFLLHALWPFLWIWATLYKPGYGWGLSEGQPSHEPVEPNEIKDEINFLKEKISELESLVVTENEKED